MCEAEMDPSFRSPPGPAPHPPNRDSYRELKKRLDQLRKPIPPPKPPHFCPEPQPFADLGDVFDAFEDPTDTLQEKTERLIHEPREEVSLDDLPDVPQTEKPIIDTFSRLLTPMLDGQTIEITPKTKEIEEKNLSEQLQKLFPDIDQKVNEKEKDFKLDIENLSQVLSEIGKSEIVPFEFEFFHGGQNEKFSEIICSLAPTTDNLEFLDFLQSDDCRNILVDNKLKIHVETGNIYYDDKDTNESIHDFIIAQQNPISGAIEHNFVFDHDYITYFDWLINGFSTSQKQKLDIFKNKNSKFLFYHFNEYSQQAKLELKKIKHSVVMQDYIAAEEIQNKDWQYFVESVLKSSIEPKEKESVKQFQLDTLENITIVKKTYEKLYNTVAKSFFSTLQKLPFEERENISDDFAQENFDLNDSESLDSWVAFYYKFGRFPGSQEVVILPQIQTPELIGSASIGLSPIYLYKKFHTGESKGLVSLQALAALLIHFGGERITAKRAMDEWQSNLLFQTLSKENDSVIMQFEKVGKLVYDILRAFLLDSSPELFNEDDSAYLKTAITISKTNLDATIEAVEEKNKQVL